MSIPQKISCRFGIPVLALVCVSLQTPARPAATPFSDWHELVAAERAFARASVERGMRTAFLEYLADDAVIFRPGPVEARPHIEARDEVDGTLAWEPLQAEVSFDGTLGYTTGPWTFTAAGGAIAHGHYVSLWRRQQDGRWRVELDLGTEHPPFDSVREMEPPRRAPRSGGTGDDAGLAAAARQFAELATTRGTRAAYRRHADSKLRLHRPGLHPVTRRKEVRRLLENEDHEAGWQVETARTAPSGDLGYTYGTFEAAGEAPRFYLHIWKRRGPSAAWRMTLEVLLAPANPAETGAGGDAPAQGATTGGL